MLKCLCIYFKVGPTNPVFINGAEFLSLFLADFFYHSSLVTPLQLVQPDDSSSSRTISLRKLLLSFTAFVSYCDENKTEIKYTNYYNTKMNVGVFVSFYST